MYNYDLVDSFGCEVRFQVTSGSMGKTLTPWEDTFEIRIRSQRYRMVKYKMSGGNIEKNNNKKKTCKRSVNSIQPKK